MSEATMPLADLKTYLEGYIAGMKECDRIVDEIRAEHQACQVEEIITSLEEEIAILKCKIPPRAAALSSRLERALSWPRRKVVTDDGYGNVIE